MKRLTKQALRPILARRAARSGNWGLLTVAALALAATSRSNAQVIALADNNSTALIDVSSQNGMFNWNVQGINQLQQQWFWYGVGNGPVASIDTISAPAIVVNSPREATITYTLPGSYSVSVNYFLFGGPIVPIGPAFGDTNAVADLTETVTVANLSGAALPFHLYQYADFGFSGGRFDYSRVQKNLHGLYDEADEVDTGGDYASAVATNGANHAEVAFWGQTLAKLNSGSPVTLGAPYFDGPIGPGDVTWALQWDLNITPGSSAPVSVDEFVSNVRNLPEPSAVALIGLGVAGRILVRRRRHRCGLGCAD